MANALARKFRLDVTNDLTLGSGFLQIKGVDDFDDGITPDTEESTSYDTSGQKTYEKTLEEVKPVVSFFRLLTGGVYDPGQEIIRFTRLKFGDNARVGLRWYDRQGGPEAYQAVFIPEWKRSATGVGNLDKASVTFDLSDIAAVEIANPILGLAVPVITRATPAAQTAGNQIVLTGGGFTGTTGITVGGVAVGAGKFQVLSDATIVFIVPAGSAGSAPIIVTNAAGPSAAFSYTRGA